MAVPTWEKVAFHLITHKITRLSQQLSLFIDIQHCLGGFGYFLGTVPLPILFNTRAVLNPSVPRNSSSLLAKSRIWTSLQSNLSGASELLRSLAESHQPTLSSPSSAHNLSSTSAPASSEIRSHTSLTNSSLGSFQSRPTPTP